MIYTTLQLPFKVDFDTMSKKDFISYGQWFHSVMPDRIDELRIAVNSTPNFEDWKPDFSPDSLVQLGVWLKRVACNRKLTEEELDKLRVNLPSYITPKDEDLSFQTISLSVDIGMYFGEVMRKNVAGLRWDQIFGSRKFARFGRPVIAGVGKIVLDPVIVVANVASALIDGRNSPQLLRELFDRWSKNLS